MKHWALTVVMTSTLIGFSSFSSLAATCDQYPGDAWIYSGVTSNIKPNVLIIIDTSGSMSDTVPGSAADYDPTQTYTVQNACRSGNSGGGGGSGSPANCSSPRVYYQDSKGRWVDAGFNLSSVTTTCNGANPKNNLSTGGLYTGRSLTGSGICAASGTTGYATGNWVNWNAVANTPVPKIDVARNVVKSLISSTIGVNFGVMVYNNPSSVVKQSQGSRFFTYAASGTNKYTSTVKEMDAIFTGTMTNREALLASINTTTVVASGYTPLAESLYEAGQYFRGGQSAFGNTIGLSGTPAKYTSPIEVSCQKNYIIFVTDGMSTSDDDPVLKTVCPPSNTSCQGDYDGDGKEPGDMTHSMDDVAKYLYDADLLPDVKTAGNEYTIDKQNISTYTIGFGNVGSDAAAVALLQRAAENGHGSAYLAADQSALSSALTLSLASMMSVDSSFVAPVVPVSPENRTYGSSRVYMGFFKPRGQYWYGNLKKYGLDTKNNIIDKNGNQANWIDADNNGIDDNTGETLPNGASNGSFRNTSFSYWSTSVDAAEVDKGGVGEKLLLRTTSRVLYTYKTASSTLIPFSKTTVDATMLNVADVSEKDKLIDFIYGIDAYDENANGNITEKRKWLFGDVLHSRPVTVNYASYQMSNEANCNVNKTMIYVGSNDGMLHAIKDCDGSEAWAFIPPDILVNLKEIPEEYHTYYVDGMPTVYIYDANNDGNIDLVKDKVIMMIGMRRGGGSNATPSKGSYYLLDVTDPTVPKYIWSLSNAGFSELGESFGDPKIVKLNIGGTTKIAAFIGAGYDNLNEDGRYGATQTFDGSGTVNNSDSASGNLTSSGTAVQSNPKGRGVYAVEIATITSGVPTVSPSPTRIWGVVNGGTTNYAVSPATDSGMTFPIVSEIATLDTDGNGFADRLYATDLGGNLWRFDIGNSSVSSWRGYKIFSAGSGGRKAFYKPAVTLEASITDSSRGNDALVFIGTGDREHPLNTAVVDRIYAVRDKGQKTAMTESNLLDFTADQLQATTIVNTSSNTATPTSGSVDDWLKQLNASANYGWYIKLDQSPGEKILASPTVFNKVAYFTSYTPGANSSNSSTSLSLGAGSKTLTVATGLPIISNLLVFIDYNSANKMRGRVTSYNSSTGSLVVNISSYIGSGTYNYWQVTWGDPCQPTNLGSSRIYSLNYLTGESVLNYDKNNDGTSTTNKRAQAKPGAEVLLRSDRVKTLGSGIASGIVLVVNPDGKVKALIGCGGGICPEETVKGGSILNLYWGQKK